MLIEVVEGFFCDPELVAVVKATGKDSCAVFTAGQSAVDGGFALPYPAEEVAEQINEAYDEPGDQEDEENEVEEDS